MRGKKRPTSERARAVGIALVDGVSTAAAATGIPERTIRQWQDTEEFAELRQRTKDQVADEWWAGVQRGFRIVITGFDGPEPLQQKATAAAILFDKLALMRGEATSRSEVRPLAEEYNDHELATLNTVLRDELARRTDQRATETAVGVPAATGADTPGG